MQWGGGGVLRTTGEGAIEGQESDVLVIAPVGKLSSCSGLPDGDVRFLVTSAPSHALENLSELPSHHGRPYR